MFVSYRKKAISILLTLVLVIGLMPVVSFPALAADTVVDFTALKNGTNYKEVGDCFLVSPSFVLAMDTPSQPMYAFDTNAQTYGAEQTVVIKADGSDNKCFTLKDIAITKHCDTDTDDNKLAVFTMTFKDIKGDDISTYTLSSNAFVGRDNRFSGGSITNISALPFDKAFPTSGVANVSEVEIKYKFIGNLPPSLLNFEYMTVANISKDEKPTVSTNAVTSITSTGCTVSGTVQAEGFSALTERGFIYSALPTPLIDCASSRVLTDRKASSGEMTAVLSGLTPMSKYYVRAYAKNSYGISYGSVVGFSTLAAAPGPPTQVTAKAGDAKAEVSFKAPDSTGGAPISSYTVTAYPGGLTATGTKSPITITGLTNGIPYSFTVSATSPAGTGPVSALSSPVVPNGPTGTTVTVNGKKLDIATESTQLIDGRTVTSINVGTILPINLGQTPTVLISTTVYSDVIQVFFAGQTVKNLEQSSAVIEIRTRYGGYVLPASQIGIDGLAQQFGSQTALSDIRLRVSFASLTTQTAQLVSNAAVANGLQIVAGPVEFEIACLKWDKSVQLTRFGSFVERRIPIPDTVNTSKISTGVALNSDGSFRHIPTVITKIDGKNYACMRGLTNSIYAVVYNPVSFKDVENHWSKPYVNDMGSRLIVNGDGNGNFSPERAITRAEFATIVVRALGLPPGMTESAFADVSLNDGFNGYVETATEYGLITGYDGVYFGPNDLITREQAMVIIARAMKITGLSSGVSDAEATAILLKFSDRASVSDYAKGAAAACVKIGVVNGTSADTIAPKSNVKRCEVTAMAQRLLKSSGLI